MFTRRPWLAADPVLGPAAAAEGDIEVLQTGAWFLAERGSLPEEVEAFLTSGSPPIYLGLGSMRASSDTGRVLVEAARALGLRSILSRGWADLEPPDPGPDCLLVDDIAHEALFPRVAAIVHHGGAGTTSAAARAGRPQVVVPHLYDQPYWAHRVQQLGIGVSGPSRGELSATMLAAALRECMSSGIIQRARDFPQRIDRHGAQRAALLLSQRPGGGDRAG